MKTHTVSAHLLTNGFVVSVDTKSYKTIYPKIIWAAFPQYLRPLLSQTAAYFYTHHLTLAKNCDIFYEFPPPALSSLFIHGLFYALPEAVLEFPDARFTAAKLLQTVYNSGYRTHFSGTPALLQAHTPFIPTKRAVVMPFSFGKDSLLTFAVTVDIGLSPILVFFREPTSPYENINKEALRKKFNEEFSLTITSFTNNLGNLREGASVMWGWDLLLTQYTLLLIPYVYASRAKYFFWSNERSTNESVVTPDGYRINPTHEQGVAWTLHLNNLLRSYGANTVLSSLHEPIHELGVLYILHHRYPEIGKYQLSCLNDTNKPVNKRWCGDCYECARVFMFLLAIGVDPARVGFTDNMLGTKKKKLHHLFSKEDRSESVDILFQSKGERLLAFYLSNLRGVRGDLMTLFQQELLPLVEKQKNTLIKKYLTFYEDAKTVPSELQKRVFPIYRKELETFRKEITSNRLAPVDISV